jgi:acyl-[acyl-carrier-protein]-phospholipid O-acyltransferase/long-chain-fatty-acid--[acyl-carrier-protein] ligase
MNSKTKWIPLFASNFLGVFNNNFFKTLICLLAINWVAKGNESLIVSLASGLYVLSYIFFSPLAGRLSKTMYKKKIMIAARIAELILIIIGSFGFYIESIYMVMACIFLLGLVSTLFSPSKYGLIRDIGGSEGISFGTGTLEMFTFFGAILGPLLATIVSDHYNFYMMAGLFVIISLISLFAISRLKVSESEPMKKSDDTIIPFIFEYKAFKYAATMKGLNLIILGLSSFWMVGSFLQMNLLVHCPQTLGMTNTQTGYVLTASAVGIGLGSFLAGIISKGKVELGLTPIGGLGMTISLLVLYFLQPTGILFGFMIFLTALFCGIYMVPLSASVQNSVEGRKQGDMLAYSNFLIFLLIFISAALFAVITKHFGTNSIFIFLVILIFTMSLLMIKYVPNMLVRFKGLLKIK